MYYHLYIKSRTNDKYIIEYMCINYLWEDTKEAGNHSYLWEREEMSGWGDGIGRETTAYHFITFENGTMWLYYLFNK